MKFAFVLLVLVAAGCSSAPHQHVATEKIRNAQGHVVGHKEMLIDTRNGEKLEQVTHYVPLLDDRGEVVAYQEPVRGGTLIRAIDGRRIGARYADLRSRGYSGGGEGVMLTFRPAERLE